MGQTYTRLAGLTREIITEFCNQTEGTMNTFSTKNGKYMIEYSNMSHRDGAITATVKKFSRGGSVTANSSLRIEGNGLISRGPKMLKDLPIRMLEIDQGSTPLRTPWLNKYMEPNPDNLWKQIMVFVNSYKVGGANHHIAESYGHIPYPTGARVIDLKTKQVIVEWKAGMFQVWE